MPNAKDYKPTSKGIFAGIAAPPGKGKSHLIRSMAEVGKLAVAITDPAELDLYGGYDLEYELFSDEGWSPRKKEWGATDHVRLLKWIEATSKRPDIRCIGLDHMSGAATSPGASDLAMNDSLKIHQVGNPLELAHGQAYIGHANNMRDLLTELRRAAARGKHVMAAVLVQLRESETEVKPGGNEFMEQLLPAVHGTVRQHLSASFSLWLHGYTTGSGPGTEWHVSAIQDKVRPAKGRIQFKEKDAKGKAVNITCLPNVFAEILEVIK